MPDALPLFTAVDLARLYRFPASAPGQTVGIILLGVSFYLFAIQRRLRRYQF